MKKAIIIYDTKFGNTEKIAKSLARGMKEQGVTVDCLKVEDVDTDKLTEYDLVAIGGPTHAFGASEPMKRFFKKLENVNLKGKKAFAFDTKIRHRFSGSAANRIEKRQKKFGMCIVRPRSSAIVKGRDGPLEDGMEEMFKQIAVEISKTI